MRLLPRATATLSFVSIFLLWMRGALAGPPPELAKLDAVYPSLDALYQDLHRNPELSNHEEKTAAKMATRLRELGFEVTEHVGGHGVVGVLRNGPGSTVLVRTDMDALPIKEQTGLPYASSVTSKNDAAVPMFFKLLVDLDAVDAAACLKFSQHAVAKGDGVKALALAEDAIHLEPPTAERLRHLAGLLAAAGRHDEARAREAEAEVLTATFHCAVATA